MNLMEMEGSNVSERKVCCWCEVNTAKPDGLCDPCREELDRLEAEFQTAELTARHAEEFTADKTVMFREYLDTAADQDAPGPEWTPAGRVKTPFGEYDVWVRGS